MKGNNNNVILWSLVITLVYILIINLLYALLIKFELGGPARIFQIAGAGLTGVIQVLCFFVCVYCLMSLYISNSYLSKQFSGFSQKVLPSSDQAMVTLSDLRKIKLDILYLERQGFHNELNSIILGVSTHTSTNQNTDPIQVLDANIESKKSQKESNLELIRYAISSMMTLGFIGTLIGLASAIGKSYLAKTDEGMEVLTGYLYVAFDTTLYALFLSLIVNYFYHKYLKELDLFYSNAKMFIIENLLSKFEKVTN
jgi:biopolymer transport protein ExbB/TolQ